MKPGTKTAVIEVDSPDRTAIEEVMESLTGEEANPFVQLVLIALIISGLVIVLKKGQKKRQSVWDDDLPMIEAPLEAPALDAFSNPEENPTDFNNQTEALPIPNEGLPEGWSEEQWLHYGHQYLEMQESENGQNEK